MFNEKIGSYMTLKYKFDGVRFDNGRFIPVNWDLDINMAGVHKNSDIDEEHLQMSVAYQKVNMFLDYFLTNVFVVGSNDTDVVDIIYNTDFDNTIVQLPGTATDDIFVETIHSKLRVLAGDALIIGEVSLSASDTRTKFHFSDIADGYHLPKQEEWMELDEMLYTTPWWERHDCDLWEPMLQDDMTREDMIAQVSTAMILEGIEEEVRSALLGDDNDEPSDAELIDIDKAKGKWKPTIVQ